MRGKVTGDERVGEVRVTSRNSGGCGAGHNSKESLDAGCRTEATAGGARRAVLISSYCCHYYYYYYQVRRARTPNHSAGLALRYAVAEFPPYICGPGLGGIRRASSIEKSHILRMTSRPPEQSIMIGQDAVMDRSHFCCMLVKLGQLPSKIQGTMTLQQSSGPERINQRPPPRILNAMIGQHRWPRRQTGNVSICCCAAGLATAVPGACLTLASGPRHSTLLPLSTD